MQPCPTLGRPMRWDQAPTGETFVIIHMLGGHSQEAMLHHPSGVNYCSSFACYMDTPRYPGCTVQVASCFTWQLCPPGSAAWNFCRLAFITEMSWNLRAGLCWGYLICL